MARRANHPGGDPLPLCRRVPHPVVHSDLHPDQPSHQPHLEPRPLLRRALVLVPPLPRRSPSRTHRVVRPPTHPHPPDPSPHSPHPSQPPTFSASVGIRRGFGACGPAFANTRLPGVGTRDGPHCHSAPWEGTTLRGHLAQCWDLLGFQGVWTGVCQHSGSWEGATLRAYMAR